MDEQEFRERFSQEFISKKNAKQIVRQLYNSEVTGDGISSPESLFWVLGVIALATSLNIMSKETGLELMDSAKALHIKAAEAKGEQGLCTNPTMTAYALKCIPKTIARIKDPISFGVALGEIGLAFTLQIIDKRTYMLFLDEAQLIYNNILDNDEEYKD